MKQPSKQYLMNGSAPQTDKKKVRKAKSEYKQLKARYELAAKENRITHVTVPIEANNQAKEWLQASNLTVLATVKSKKDDKKSDLLIELPKPIDGFALDLGKALKDIEVRAVGHYAAVLAKKEKAKESKPFEMTFKKEVATGLYEQMANRFHVIGKTASLSTGEITLTFDLYDCETLESRTRRICQILEAANHVQNNRSQQLYLAQLQSLVNDIAPVQSVGFVKTANYYKRMTGKEMIEKGIANVIDSTSKAAKGFQKVLNWLFGKSKMTYKYFGNVIFPENSYVVQVDEKLDSEQPIDFIEELYLRYDFGQQVYNGKGIEIATDYFNQIVTQYNEIVKDVNSIEAQRSSDTY